MSTTPNNDSPELLQAEHASVEMGRLDSLDAFRGLAIAGMVAVNNPGTWDYVYAPLLHVEWNGLTPADLIFPAFIFMVGVSIAFSFCKRLAAGTSRCSLAKKVICRALKIYLVGMLLYVIGPVISMAVEQSWAQFDAREFFSQLRYTGVLHRIALVFLACGLLFLYTKPKVQVFVCAAFLVGYCLCMMCIPVPGQEKVELRPGNNLATWVDGKLLPGRTWWGPWNHERNWEEWKQTEPDMQPWDPEGFLSTVPAIASGLIGVFAGLLLLSGRTRERQTIILFFSGALLMAGGYLWGLCFPINKGLWTSSYVLFSSGFACTALAACVYYMDILGRKCLLRFFVVFGCNAITIYCLSTVLALFLYGNDFGFWGESSGPNHMVMNWLMANAYFPAKLASLTYALLFVLVNFIPAYILYKLKIYVRL